MGDAIFFEKKFNEKSYLGVFIWLIIMLIFGILMIHGSVMYDIITITLMFCVLVLTVMVAVVRCFVMLIKRRKRFSWVKITEGFIEYKYIDDSLWGGWSLLSPKKSIKKT